MAYYDQFTKKPVNKREDLRDLFLRVLSLLGKSCKYFFGVLFYIFDIKHCFYLCS